MAPGSSSLPPWVSGSFRAARPSPTAGVRPTRSWPRTACPATRRASGTSAARATPSIQGFATDISVNRGETVQFKIDTTATAYRLDIYRLGYYGGNGARKVATVQPSAALPQTPARLPEPDADDRTGRLRQLGACRPPGRCRRRGLRASTSPSSCANGHAAARATSSSSSATTTATPTCCSRPPTPPGRPTTATAATASTDSPGRLSGAGRAYKVSYNRPFTTRGVPTPEDWLFNAEYPMIRWLERNGYDVSYITGVDTRSPRRRDPRAQGLPLGRPRRVLVRPAARERRGRARDAGVNLAFFSGNEIFWKTRWETQHRRRRHRPTARSSATRRRTPSAEDRPDGRRLDRAPGATRGSVPPADGGRPRTR